RTWTRQADRGIKSGNRALARGCRARSQRSALRAGFSAQNPEGVSTANGLLADRGGSSRSSFNPVAGTNEESLCRAKNRRKIEAPPSRGRLRTGRAQNRSHVAAAGDCRSCPEPAQWFCRQIVVIEEMMNFFSDLRGRCAA